MRAGSLKKRATFQKLTTVSDGAGGTTKTWADFATVWAGFLPENVKEKIQQGRIADQTAGRIVVLYSSLTAQIDGTFRVVIDGVTMNVKSRGIDIEQNRAELVFPVETDGVSGQG
ncbi:phage head closure protein [Nitrobacteraceae bacterium UC4446_H13]